jgi:hypothetical protein
MGLAAVIKDPSNHLVSRRIQVQAGGSSTEAEARAILLGIQSLQEIAGDEVVQDVWRMHCDCESIAKVAALLEAPPAHFSHQDVIKEIHKSRGGMLSQWIPRKENRDADQCANLAHHIGTEQAIEVPAEWPTALQGDQQNQINRWRRAQRRLLHQQRKEWKVLIQAQS